MPFGWLFSEEEKQQVVWLLSLCRPTPNWMASKLRRFDRRMTPPTR